MTATRRTNASRTQRHALRWPNNWPRTPSYARKEANFDGDRTLAQSVAALVSELNLMLATDIVVTCSDFDPSVAVWFTHGELPRVLASDRWDNVAHNAWAIAQHVKALRGQARWGVGTVTQAFAGYSALIGAVDDQSPTGRTVEEPRVFTGPWPKDREAHVFQKAQPFSTRGVEPRPGPWRKVLGFTPKARPTPEAIESAFKSLARVWHPDVGGTHAAMSVLNSARETAHTSRGKR